MENITELFTEIYVPTKALIIYQSEKEDEHVYVEAYDMNKAGKPINAHPLSLQETIHLANCLNVSAELNSSFTQSKGLLPDNVLYLNASNQGCVIWYTPAQEVQLLFTQSLIIPSGGAFVPPLVWKADKAALHLYAVKSKSRPDMQTPLFHAPFFNMYANGGVCMGTVDIDMEHVSCLEAFIEQWESYYWNSYFSHLIQDASPVRGNIVQLWQEQVASKRRFPLNILMPNDKNLKDILK